MLCQINFINLPTNKFQIFEFWNRDSPACLVGFDMNLSSQLQEPESLLLFSTPIARWVTRQEKEIMLSWFSWRFQYVVQTFLLRLLYQMPDYCLKSLTVLNSRNSHCNNSLPSGPSGFWNFRKNFCRSIFTLLISYFFQDRLAALFYVARTDINSSASREEWFLTLYI